MKKNVLPLPGSLSTAISPPISSTSCLLMVRPRPVPPNLRVVDASAWLKALNTFFCCSSVMPIPESLTANFAVTLSRAPSTNSTETTISPASVNLTALFARLMSTWPNRNGSPTKTSGIPLPLATSSSISFFSAFNPIRSDTFSKTLSRLKSTNSTSSFPASILETSRISLMIPSRVFEAPSTFCR